MKKIKFNTPKNLKRKITVTLLLIGVLLSIVYVILVRLNEWYETHRFVFHAPVEVNFFQPIKIEERQIEFILPQPPIEQIVDELPELKDFTPTEVKICNKWGPYECRIAVAISRAESGMREDAFNANTNGSIDLGLFQINSVHYGKEGCSMKDVVTEDGNIECAYQIWEQQGWNPWTVWKTGAFKDKYE